VSEVALSGFYRCLCGLALVVVGAYFDYELFVKGRADDRMPLAICLLLGGFICIMWGTALCLDGLSKF